MNTFICIYIYIYIRMCERENVKSWQNVCMYINGYEREKRESEEKREYI